MRIPLLIPIAAAAVFSIPQTGAAQVNPTFADLNGAFEQARTEIQMNRKMLLMNEMQLTATETDPFWKLYDQYALDLKKVGDLRVKVITDYAANYDKMTDAVAKQLLDDGLKYQADLLNLRKSYLKKFSKILPATKVARFYQAETKLDAIMSFVLAREIPIMPTPAAGSAPISKPGS